MSLALDNRQLAMLREMGVQARKGLVLQWKRV